MLGVPEDGKQDGGRGVKSVMVRGVEGVRGGVVRGVE